jgi:phage replication-related protein YjqB (UPF0714/DUF867 family)
MNYCVMDGNKFIDCGKNRELAKKMARKLRKRGHDADWGTYEETPPKGKAAMNVTIIEN